MTSDKELLNIAMAEGYDRATRLVADISLRLLATNFTPAIADALNTISKELEAQKAKTLELDTPITNTCKCSKPCK